MGTIVFLGDSITKGQVSFNWVKCLQMKLPTYHLVNQGVNGELAYHAALRLEKVIEVAPDQVVILLGSNDLFSLASPAHTKRYMAQGNLPQTPTIDWYRDNLEMVLTGLIAGNCKKLILLTIPAMGEDLEHPMYERLEVYNEQVRALAIKYGCQLVDIQRKLKEYLKDHPVAKPKGVLPDLRLLVQAMVLRFVFFLPWNWISRLHGLQVTSDTLHLNETSGKLVVEMVLDAIKKGEGNGE